jgi:hypothetical protein
MGVDNLRNNAVNAKKGFSREGTEASCDDL